MAQGKSTTAVTSGGAPARRSLPHVLEAAYATAFWFLLAWYLTGVLKELLASPVSADRSYFLILALVLCYQLLRMYHYIHEFEGQIARPQQSHFLKLLDDFHARWERRLRFGIAGVIVFFPKFAEYRPTSCRIPAVMLATCFLLLLLWDCVVWRGLKQTRATKIGPTVWAGARAFFYLSNNYKAPADLGPYVKELKLWERGVGFTVGVAAFLYSDNRHPLLFMIALSLMLLFVLFPLFGAFRIGNYWKKAIPQWWQALVSYPVNPVLTVGELWLGGVNMNSTKTYRYRTFAGAYLFAILTLGVCFLAQCSRGTSPPGPRPIRVATSKNLWCALTLIADAQGYFHARGLDPQMNYQAAGRLNMDALLGGTVDFANVVETNIAYQALNRTSNLAILGRIVSATDYAILTRGSAGIQHPADLVGKRLAYAQATGAESFVFWFLEKEGISPSSLTLIPLQPAGLVDHFLGGGAEAVATWEPFVTTIRSRMASLGPTFESDGKGFAGIMTVGALRTYAEGNRSTVEAYEGAMENAARLVSDNPDLAQNIVAEQTGIPPETVRSIWHRFDFRYEKSTSRDGALIEEVISRIQRNLPDMSAREPADVRSYYIPVQGTNP